MNWEFGFVVILVARGISTFFIYDVIKRGMFCVSGVKTSLLFFCALFAHLQCYVTNLKMGRYLYVRGLLDEREADFGVCEMQHLERKLRLIKEVKLIMIGIVLAYFLWK